MSHICKAQAISRHDSENALYAVVDKNHNTVSYPASKSDVGKILNLKPKAEPHTGFATKMLSMAKSPAKAGPADVDLSIIPDLYGTIYYTAQNPAPYTDGIFRFPNPDNKNFKIIATGMASADPVGGFIKDGVYYESYWWSLREYNLNYIYLMGYQLETTNGRNPQVFNATSSNLTDASISHTYSPADNTIYCLSLTRNAEGVALSTLSITGSSFAVTKITDLPGKPNDYESIAADASGNLYCITKTIEDNKCTKSTLSKMDKSTGALTTIGDTGILPLYRGSATIDLATGEMYWSVADADNLGYLAKVDLQTGTTTKIYDYPYNEGFVGLSCLAKMPKLLIPDIPTATSCSFEGLSLSGTISFKTPAKYTDGSAGQGKLTYHVKANDNEIASAEADYNQAITLDVTVDRPGKYTFSIYCSSEDGNGEPAKIYTYIGPGIPETPTNTSAQYIGGGKIKVSWAFVSNAVDGGSVVSDDVIYRVKRITDGESTEVFAGKTTYNYIDAVEVKEGKNIYSYEIIADYEGQLSEPALTENVSISTAATPYANEVASFADFLDFFIYNSIDRTYTWYYSPFIQGAAISEDYSDPKDDWIFLPGMKLEAGYTYQVSVDAWCKSEAYPEKIEVKYGISDIVSEMTESVIPITSVDKTEPMTLTGTINAQSTQMYYIGIHACSDSDQWELYVRNIKVSSGVQASVPGIVTGLTATAAGSSLSAAISFTAPVESASGGPLREMTKIEIYRGEALIHTITTPQPGEKYTYTDTEAFNGNNTYTVLAYNETGASAPATTDVFCGVSYPVTPSSVTVTETSTPGEVTVEWSAVTSDIDGRSLDDSQVGYNIYVTDGYTDTRLVAENIKGTSHTFKFIEEGQEFVLAKVCAVTAMGEGNGKISALVPVGTPYKGYHESVPDGECNTLLGVNTSGGAQWAILTNTAGFYSYDDDSGYFACYGDTNGQYASIISGKVSLEGIENPGLFFYVLPLTSGSVNDVKNEIEVSVYEPGQEPTPIFSSPINELGDDLSWKRVNVSLYQYAGKTICFAIKVTVRSHVYTIIDNLNIATVHPFDVAVEDITAPTHVRTATGFSMSAKISNIGINDADNITVNLLAGDKVTATQSIGRLPKGKTVSLTFNDYMHALAESAVEYTVEASYDADNNKADNTASVSILPHLSYLPVVTDLSASSADNGSANLSWSMPDLSSSTPEWILEDFESAPAFAQEYGKWKFIDRDNKPSGLFDGIMDVNFNGIKSGDRTSFFIFNNSGLDRSFETLSGKQCLVALPAKDGTATDDWAISPILSGEAHILSFYAKNYSPFYKERVEIWVSTTTDNPDDFVKIDEMVIGHDDWYRFVNWLEKGTKYFAVRSCAENGLFLMLDDFQFTPAIEATDIALEGYNVYRDGERINTATVENTSYNDATCEVGKPYTYRVTAQYREGESTGSNTVDIITTSEADIENGITITVTTGAVCIAGASGKTVSVYDLKGTMIYGAHASDYTTVPLASGVYIIKVSDTIAKVSIQ